MPELELLALREQLERDDISYCLATVVAVRGSASAKPGSKMLISSEGKNLWGWVGGGCAEGFTFENALEAMRERRPRLITADLNDEIFGLGMPCGGEMDIFLEPRLPDEELFFSFGANAQLRSLATNLGFTPRFAGAESHELSPKECVLILAKTIAKHRGLSLERFTKPASRQTKTPTEFLILGHSRITEELAKLGVLLDWPTRVYGLNMQAGNYPPAAKTEEVQPEFAGLHLQKGSFVVVASHHKGDRHYLSSAIEAQAAYIGLVASHKRAKMLFEQLETSGFSADALKAIHAPAGLELHCRNPGEIAISILTEILTG